MTKFVDIHRKIAVIGDIGVGKSSLTERYANGRFSDSYDPTIESTFRKTIIQNSSRLTLEIVDTAGISEYSSRLSRNSTVGVHGYLLVFSISSRSSLEKIRAINNLLFNTLGDPPHIPRLLVGTMSDLNEQRAVSAQVGVALAKELGIPYIECSSKNGVNIDEVFLTILKVISDENTPQGSGSQESEGSSGSRSFCSVS